MAAEFSETQYRFAAHIRAPADNPRPDDVEDRRMAIYRELFYNNVEGFLTNSFPVLKQVLDETQWNAMARDFFANHRSHSPLFAEIPREFVNYLEQERVPDPQDPPFLHELAHYEWVELALSIAEAGGAPQVDDDGDLLRGVPVLSPLAWPLQYRFAVHRIGPDYQPEDDDQQATYLIVYRDPDDKVGFVELNTVSARLFSLLQESGDRRGIDALDQIGRELRHSNPETVREGGCQILASWKRLGIVLGTRRQ